LWSEKVAQESCGRVYSDGLINVTPATPFYLNAVVLFISAVLVATMLRETREVRRGYLACHSD
jgi:hypothetical protein